MGEAADREAVQAIREIVTKGAHVEHVNEVLTLQMGPEYDKVLTTAPLTLKSIFSLSGSRNLNALANGRRTHYGNIW